MNGRLTSPPRSEWAPAARDRTAEPREHRCGKCFGPFGKSAIRCVNEPDPLDRLLAADTTKENEK